MSRKKKQQIFLCTETVVKELYNLCTNQKATNDAKWKQSTKEKCIQHQIIRKTGEKGKHCAITQEVWPVAFDNINARS